MSFPRVVAERRSAVWAKGEQAPCRGPAVPKHRGRARLASNPPSLSAWRGLRRVGRGGAQRDGLGVEQLKEADLAHDRAADVRPRHHDVIVEQGRADQQVGLSADGVRVVVLTGERQPAARAIRGGRRERRGRGDPAQPQTVAVAAVARLRPAVGAVAGARAAAAADARVVVDLPGTDRLAPRRRLRADVRAARAILTMQLSDPAHRTGRLQLKRESRVR